MKKLKKLSLKKETIVRLEKDGMSDLKGGFTTTTNPIPPPTILISIQYCTRGKCDIYTIGDDEEWCISNTYTGCGI